jgi:hypothetical protein
MCTKRGFVQTFGRGRVGARARWAQRDATGRTHTESTQTPPMPSAVGSSPGFVRTCDWGARALPRLRLQAARAVAAASSACGCGCKQRGPHRQPAVARRGSAGRGLAGTVWRSTNPSTKNQRAPPHLLVDSLEARDVDCDVGALHRLRLRVYPRGIVGSVTVFEGGGVIRVLPLHYNTIL